MTANQDDRTTEDNAKKKAKAKQIMRRANDQFHLMIFSPKAKNAALSMLICNLTYRCRKQTVKQLVQHTL